MSENLNSFCFTSHGHDNWFYKRYYYCGSNCRYFTFQLALNMLASIGRPPVIVETGCQRMEEDVGAGMSTSVWAEFCSRNGGKLYTIELSKQNLDVCRSCTRKWSDQIEYFQSDSVLWLQAASGITADLLYLDSMDYDYGGLLNIYGGQNDISAAIKAVEALSLAEVLTRHSNIIVPSQEHCLNELKAALSSGVVKENTIVLIDDNQLPGGGKSRLAKEYLTTIGWKCLLDFQQSMWVKK